MRRHRMFIIVLALVLALTALAAGCGGDESEATPPEAAETDGEGTGGKPQTLKIGFSGDFSGALAAYDLPLKNGIEFAAKQINNQGGIDGFTVEIATRDNKGDPTLTATTTQELIDDGFLLQLLGTADGMVAPGRLISEAGGIAMSGMHTTPSIVLDIGERAVSFIFSDMAQAGVAAQYACDQGYETVYLLEAPEFDYTKYMPRHFKDAFAEVCDGKTVGEDIFKLGQTDFAAQVTKIKNAGDVDVIYSGMFLPDTGAFLKQLRAAGIDTPFIGGDGNDSKFFIDSAGSAAEGAVYTAHGAGPPGSELEKFTTEYTELMGEEPEAFTFEAVGRDHVYALVEAAKQAGSTNPDAILEAIMALKDVELVTGKIGSMNPETRYPDKPVFLVKIENGERAYPEPIVPDYLPPVLND